MAEDKGYDRFRSFAERYVIARAGSFDPNKSLEDSWACVQEAKKVYMLIARASDDLEGNNPALQISPTISPSSMLGLTGSVADDQIVMDALHNGDVCMARMVRDYVTDVRNQGMLMSGAVQQAIQMATAILAHDAAKNIVPQMPKYPTKGQRK